MFQISGPLDAANQSILGLPLLNNYYAVFDRSLERVQISLAGHLPPVIAAAGRPAEVADIAPGLMIGVDASVRRRTSTVDMPPGALLCLYTDGLIERREYPIDEGLARLCKAVIAEPPERACASVMGALVGGDLAPDDIALLVIRREP